MWALIGLIAGYSLGALEGDTFIGAALGLALGLALDAWRKTADLQSQLEALQQQVATLRLQLTGSSPDKAAQQPAPETTTTTAAANSSLDAISGTWADPQGVLTQDHAVDAVPQTTVTPVPKRFNRHRAANGHDPDTVLNRSTMRMRPRAMRPPGNSRLQQCPPRQFLQPLFDLFRNVSPLVLAGLAVLFLGLSFLATYFAHQGLLSMELRLGFIGLWRGLGWLGLAGGSATALAIMQRCCRGRVLRWCI